MSLALPCRLLTMIDFCLGPSTPPVCVLIWLLALHDVMLKLAPPTSHICHWAALTPPCNMAVSPSRRDVELGPPPHGLMTPRNMAVSPEPTSWVDGTVSSGCWPSAACCTLCVFTAAFRAQLVIPAAELHCSRETMEFAV